MRKKLLTNGRIYTVKGDSWNKKPQKNMLIRADGRIELVGQLQAPVTEDVEIIDLQGKTVLPGLIDSHVHVPGMSLTELLEADLFSLKSREELRERIGSFLKEHPKQDTLYGTGFDMSIQDEEGNPPCAKWIDDLAEDKMIILQSGDMHSMLLNTKAMETIGLLKKDFVYEGPGRIHKDAAGCPTGLLTDTWDIDIPKHVFSKEEITEALLDFQKKMLAWGYTGIMAAAPFAKGLPIEILQYPKDKLGIHINGSILIRPKERKSRMEQLIKEREKTSASELKISTAKYMIDGVIEGNTAYLKHAYCNREGFTGTPVWKYSELTESFEEAIKNGFQIHAHVIGDAAVQMTLDAIIEARKAAGNADLRHVLTHLQLVDVSDFHKFGAAGIIAAVQTFWHYKEPGFYENIEVPALGRHRSENMYPLRSLKENGAVITASGDYPVSPDNDPLLGIQMGITRNAWNMGVADPDDTAYLLSKEERLTVKDMVEAYTINGAYQLFREKEIGSLEAGKLADYIVLSDDPFEVEPMKISRIKVMETCLSGKTVYKIR
ncbi:amidohydrolase [Anaerovorax odorimutans]|nr:amidohydrolase [Anaerovorax odorimutans]